LIKTGSLCPAAKSAEIIGDKWILLILRELFLGTTRFNDFQRALPRMSPSILSKRLRKLEADGLVIRRKGSGERTKEYRLTRAGRELAPIVDHMATWGLRWARRRIAETDIDIGTFMWDFHRTANLAELPDGETVLKVKFSDVDELSNWWLIIEEGNVDLCTEDPGRDVDLYVTGPFDQMVEVWMGDVELQKAVADEQIVVSGSSHLTKTIGSWFPKSMYSDIQSEK
jgi:DNA-binding HxlR family transcriptional regulator